MVVTVYPAASTGTAPTEVKRKVSRSPSLVLGATFPSRPPELRTDNRVPLLKTAKAEFEASWKQ
jgi:hypothetical protein